MPMFVQNQINASGNHKHVIITQMDWADEMRLAVAYIRDSGVDMVLKKITTRRVQLLCNLEMSITQLSSIQRLLEHGVEVKIYQTNTGTLHSKIWLFGIKQKCRMLLGSANVTGAALTDNVEASVLVDDDATVADGLRFFDYLWNQDHASAIGMADIRVLQEQMDQRENFRIELSPTASVGDLDDEAKIETLLKYTNSWIDNPDTSARTHSLWRGWYILPPARGVVNDDTIKELTSYLPLIGSGIDIGGRSTDQRYKQLLDQFVQNNPPKGKGKTPLHKLFAIRAQYYLIAFGWCYRPLKSNGKQNTNLLQLTDLGRRIEQCQDLICVKNLYTDFFLAYTFNGLPIVQFTKHLLRRLGFLTLGECDYFVTHANHWDDLETIINLVQMYRSLKYTYGFKSRFSAYFERKKGSLAEKDYDNYRQFMKHAFSIIGWCAYFTCDSNFTLRLSDEH